MPREITVAEADTIPANGARPLWRTRGVTDPNADVGIECHRGVAMAVDNERALLAGRLPWPDGILREGNVIVCLTIHRSVDKADVGGHGSNKLRINDRLGEKAPVLEELNLGGRAGLGQSPTTKAGLRTHRKPIPQPCEPVFTDHAVPQLPS